MICLNFFLWQMLPQILVFHHSPESWLYWQWTKKSIVQLAVHVTIKHSPFLTQPLTDINKTQKKLNTAKTIRPNNMLCFMLMTCASEAATYPAKLLQHSYTIGIVTILPLNSQYGKISCPQKKQDKPIPANDHP